MSRLLPPTEDHPAETLRWVRRLYLVMIPVGVLVAVLLLAEGLGAWWLGLVVVAMSLIGLATIGTSIRRAEAHGPNDPATRPERARRAERLTIAIFGVFSLVVVAASFWAEGAGLAIAMAVLLSIGLILGLWVFRRRM
jgi:hypothetical protein